MTRKFLAAALLASTAAFAACGGGGADVDLDALRRDPPVAEAIDAMESNGATDAEVDEMVAYAADQDEEGRASYLHLITYTWEN